MHLIHCAVEKRNVSCHLLNTFVFLHVYICCWLLLVCRAKSRVQLCAYAAVNRFSVNPNCKQSSLWWSIVRHQFNLCNTHTCTHTNTCTHTYIHKRTHTLHTHKHTHAHNQQSEACQATNFILGLTMFVHTSFIYRHGLLLTQVKKKCFSSHHIHTDSYSYALFI